MDSPRRLRGLLVVALTIGCGTAQPDAGAPRGDAGLPPEAIAAQDALVDALASRDPAAVGETARVASAWEGKNRTLDLLLADALANVLMRPAEAEPLLARWPPSDEPTYRALVFGKALRSSDWETIARLLPGLPIDNPVRDQLAIRARHDPGFYEDAFVRAMHACALLDREPPVGRRPIDFPVPPNVLEALAAWGAPQFALGRPSQEIDPLPERGEEPFRCQGMRWLDVAELPTLAPHPMTLGVSDGAHDVYIEIKTEKNGHWGWASNDPARAGRILDAARLYSEAGGDESRSVGDDHQVRALRTMIPTLLLLACKGPGPDKPELWPFPSAHLVSDGHVAIPAEALPRTEGGTAFDVDRLAFRTGFSVVQTTVIDPGTGLDPDTLPGRDDAATPGSVQIWDLDSGERVLCFAELDAYPDLAGEDPMLLVRPLEPMTAGHRVAVVTTSALRTENGDPFSVPWFDALVDGHPAEALEAWEPHYVDLLAELDAIGARDVAFAIDFPIGDGTAPLRSAADRSAVPGHWTLDTIEDGGGLSANGWRQIQGTFDTTSFLDGNSIALDDRGEPIVQGTATADLYIYMPASIRDAAPGSVPVWVFGHGLLQTPGAYFEDDSFLDLVDRAARDRGRDGVAWAERRRHHHGARGRRRLRPVPGADRPAVARRARHAPAIRARARRRAARRSRPPRGRGSVAGVLRRDSARLDRGRRRAGARSGVPGRRAPRRRQHVVDDARALEQLAGVRGSRSSRACRRRRIGSSGTRCRSSTGTPSTPRATRPTSRGGRSSGRKRSATTRSRTSRRRP